MDDYFALFQKIINEKNAVQNLERDLSMLIKILCEELEHNKNHVSILQAQVQNLLKNPDFDITSQYLLLKESNEALKFENSTLKDEIDALNIQTITEAEELTSKFFAEKQEMITNFEHKLLEMEEELENSKKAHEQKEQKLYSELQMVQASSALQLDEIESKLTRQLNETSKKLREALNCSNTLRTELRSLKEEYLRYKNSTNQKTAELARKVEYAEERSRLAQNKYYLHDSEPPSSGDCDNINDNSIKRNADNRAKYQPLEVTCKSSSHYEDLLSCERAPPLYKEPFKAWSGDSSRTAAKNKVPPLKSCSDAKSNRKEQTKRRKLYNPEDLSYLENYQENS